MFDPSHSPRRRPAPAPGAPPPVPPRRTAGVGRASWLGLLWLLLVLPACATYPERTARGLEAFRAGRLDEAVTLYSDRDFTRSEFLAGAEAGTVAMAAGDWERAIAELDRAAARVREHEDRALISVESAGEELATLFFNEGMRSYVGEGYERVLVRSLLAKAYLATGNVEGLWVETRRANRLLTREEELYETKYRAGGLGHFLSALAYELLDEPDNALIDYRRMLEKEVGVDIAGRAAVRLAARLRRLGDFPEWVERFGEPPDLPPGAASVVLIAGVGLAPYKYETSITVPTPWGIARWAVPEYSDRPQPIERVQLVLEDAGLAVDGSVVENVRDVMRKNLSDRIGWLAVRSAGRAALKLTAREQLRKETGLLGALAGDIFTLATERADLRGWTTLPASFHAARAFVPAGVHRVGFVAVGGDSVDLGTFELVPGETLIILARTVDRRVFAHAIGGGRVDSAALPTAPEP